VAAIGTGDGFSKGRDFAAWLGLVPKQISTGDRTILGKISKRGNRYLRVLFVQAARVVLVWPQSWERHGLKPWIEAARKRLHHNVLAIALANKLARIAWAVLRPRSGLPAEDCCKCRVTKARSGPPRGYPPPPPPSATIACLIGRASEGGSEGMASRDLSDVEHQTE
jgi:Transposase IS116/IS110/IS902 family